MATLLGCPLSGALPRSFPVLVSVAQSVFSASQVMYARVPSGKNVTPCGTSIPLTSMTTLLVAGSILDSLPLLVWR